jgi:hypothetical protein
MFAVITPSLAFGCISERATVAFIFVEILSLKKSHEAIKITFLTRKMNYF